MKVTAVITVFNLERYVEEAIRSALGQKYPDLQVVVVDDASTDGSSQILAQFGNRITVVRHDHNLGVLRATLAGLAKAEGEVICLLDGDDRWAEEKVSTVSARFLAGADVVSHDCRVVQHSGAVTSTSDRLQLSTRALAAKGDAGALDRHMRDSVLRYQGAVWLGSAFCFRRASFDRERFEEWVGRLAEPSLVYQDHPIATWLALRSTGRWDYVPEALLDYRIHPDSYSGGAVDVDRAIRIARKGLLTRRATRQLTAELGAGPEVLAAQDAKIEEYEYLEAVYGRNFRAAFRHWVNCARKIWPPRQVAKEAARMGFLAVAGAPRFFALRRWVRH